MIDFAKNTNVPTNDCISRQAVIDALWKTLHEYENNTERKFQESEDLDVEDWIVHRIFVQNISDLDRQTILNLPSVQPERKRGEWVDDVAYYDEDGCPCIVSKCNQCGESNPKSNFCPNCGAEMQEVKE